MKDVKVTTGKRVVFKYRLVVCDVNIKGCKKGKTAFHSRGKVGELKKPIVKDNFATEFENVTKRNLTLRAMWKTYEYHWKVIYYDDKSCGWTKGAPKHRVKWWWNDDVDLAVKQKRDLR